MSETKETKVLSLDGLLGASDTSLSTVKPEKVVDTRDEDTIKEDRVKQITDLCKACARQYGEFAYLDNIVDVYLVREWGTKADLKGYDHRSSEARRLITRGKKAFREYYQQNCEKIVSWSPLDKLDSVMRVLNSLQQVKAGK